MLRKHIDISTAYAQSMEFATERLMMLWHEAGIEDLLDPDWPNLISEYFRGKS